MYLDLSAPTNVEATALSSNSVKVTWDQSSGATGYAISYFATATKDKRVTMRRDCSMSYTLTDLKDNTEYTIAVQSTTKFNGSDGESAKIHTSVTTSKRGE